MRCKDHGSNNLPLWLPSRVMDRYSIIRVLVSAGVLYIPGSTDAYLPSGLGGLNAH
jgi:hypothetical protein